jgi:plastocyanin
MLKLLARTTASATLLALPLLSGCGGGSSSSSCGADPTGAAAVTVHALDSLKFDQGEYAAQAGDVSIDYINDGAQIHTLVVENKGCKLEVKKRGDSDKGTVNLPPGSYKIFCDVPGHRGAGMEATLTVG